MTNHIDDFKTHVFFQKGDVVLDPFSGSGTMLVQANELGMHTIGVDISKFNCTITEAYWKQNGNELIFYISANRFLRNMVRAIVGTLLEVGSGKISVDDFRKIIESKNRSNAGLSVPAKGLFLTKVEYSYIK